MPRGLRGTHGCPLGCCARPTSVDYLGSTLGAVIYVTVICDGLSEAGIPGTENENVGCLARQSERREDIPKRPNQGRNAKRLGVRRSAAALLPEKSPPSLLDCQSGGGRTSDRTTPNCATTFDWAGWRAPGSRCCRSGSPIGRQAVEAARACPEYLPRMRYRQAPWESLFHGPGSRA